MGRIDMEAIGGDGGRSECWASGLPSHGASGTETSIMRRWFVRAALAHGALGLLHTIGEVCHLPRQRVDLLPLSGNGLVERLDGFILIGEARLQRIYASAKRVVVTHAGFDPLMA